jgi:pimeloyl-ACP methyl ester carboxylesterase
MPWMWRKLESVAHTLPYDAAIMTAFRVPRTRFASIGVRTLIMNGARTDPRLKAAARVLAQTITGAEYRELPGQTHNVKASVLTPAAIDFLASAPARAFARS